MVKMRREFRQVRQSYGWVAGNRPLRSLPVRCKDVRYAERDGQSGDLTLT